MLLFIILLGILLGLYITGIIILIWLARVDGRRDQLAYLKQPGVKKKILLVLVLPFVPFLGTLAVILGTISWGWERLFKKS